MPIYEYQCNACGFDLEKLQRINDEPLLDCPKCGKPELRRLVSAAGFRLKGAGWYETDFKKSGKKNLHDTGSSTAAQSEIKPADKPADKPAETKKTESKPAAAKPGAD
jgi:putative FmdB family regulatory protein